MLADRASAALLAVALAAAMLADRASAALLAVALAAAMLADRASAALLAAVLAAVVVAEDAPVAVPALCTAALGVTATTALVVAADTGTSTAPAIAAATEMPRQTVDQILLLPGLRQLKSGAQLLQLGDGLHARGQRNQT
jgi:hypothetical protein